MGLPDDHRCRGSCGPGWGLPATAHGGTWGQPTAPRAAVPITGPKCSPPSVLLPPPGLLDGHQMCMCTNVRSPTTTPDVQ